MMESRFNVVPILAAVLHDETTGSSTRIINMIDAEPHTKKSREGVYSSRVFCLALKPDSQRLIILLLQSDHVSRRTRFILSYLQTTNSQEATRPGQSLPRDPHIRLDPLKQLLPGVRVLRMEVPLHRFRRQSDSPLELLGEAYRLEPPPQLFSSPGLGGTFWV